MKKEEFIKNKDIIIKERNLGRCYNEYSYEIRTVDKLTVDETMYIKIVYGVNLYEKQKDIPEKNGDYNYVTKFSYTVDSSD